MATRLVSGNRITEITMQTWNGREYTPDWSGDFFNVGTLKYDENLDAYEVEDIDYCIEQAEDWQNKEGDFYGDEDPEGVERNIEVYDVDFPPITKDGEYLTEGMWVSDATGIYRVDDITADKVYLTEICFTGDDDEYELGDRRILNRSEVRNLVYA